MKIAMVIVAAACALSLAGCRSATSNAPGANPADDSLNAAQAATSRAASAGAFDYYLLNLSWSPEFCYSHPQAAECAQHVAFVLHGLWPQNTDGSYPEHCSTLPGPANPAEFQDLYPDEGLLRHEWQTHGTCSGMNADAFFAAARKAVHSVAIPAELTMLHAQASLSPAEIVSDFAQSNPSFPPSSLRISCGHNYLTAVEICLDKGLHPIACPASLRSCRASTVRIVAP
ncbi:MAG TPA: ribonuclease T2 [Terracidiphilus sp.]|nr:ribonuclease T2 [Terracidiphilus sp.]